MNRIIKLILCTFLLSTLAGCGNNSVESKLKKNGFVAEIDDKAVTFTKEAEPQLAFRYSLSDDKLDENESNKEDFNFFVISDKDEVTILFILDDFYSTTGYMDNGCILYINDSRDNDCSVANLKAIEEAKEIYSDTLDDLSLSEKELYEYMKNLYNENFI